MTEGFGREKFKHFAHNADYTNTQFSSSPQIVLLLSANLVFTLELPFFISTLKQFLLRSFQCWHYLMNTSLSLYFDLPEVLKFPTECILHAMVYTDLII